MAARPAANARRILKPLFYVTLAGSVGAGALYISYRPRTIPGSEDPVVKPPGYGEGGTFEPPVFPQVKTRQEQIADLRRSGGSVKAEVEQRHGGPSGLFRWAWAGVKKEAEEVTAKAEHDDEEYDLLIIGGGATGTGIALDAATRGLRVAMVERDDFSSGTSSKSTKLVHGGVRYLEKAVWDLDYNQ